MLRGMGVLEAFFLFFLDLSRGSDVDDFSWHGTVPLQLKHLGCILCITYPMMECGVG